MNNSTNNIVKEKTTKKVAFKYHSNDFALIQITQDPLDSLSHE